MAQQATAQRSVNTTTTSIQISDDVGIGYVRQAIILTNTSATSVVTITFGPNVAVAGAGIVLQPKSSYAEANSEGFECWQGKFQAVSDAAGTLAVVERFRTT